MRLRWWGLGLGLFAASIGNPVGGVAQDSPPTDPVSRAGGDLASKPNGDRDERWEFFEKRIRPLLVARCLECHSDEDAKGGLSLASRERWMRGGVTGRAIEAGDPESSLLMRAVSYREPDLQMPPDESLSAEEQGWLAKWIADGAFDPRAEGEAGGGSTRTFNAESHWAYRPFEAKPLPAPMTLGGVSSAKRTVEEPAAVAQGESGRAVRVEEVGLESPIDRWIEAKLASLGLEPVGSADRRSWLRRATYDMTGLPPSSAEVEAFEADERPDAYHRVVERLLASPRYGEHWGRHWLDVVRYADSNGLDENIAFGNAWRYRDYVVASLNQDKPWNRFIMEQVAGDLLPDVTLETRTGTGFLVLGAKVLAEPDRDKLIWDTIDEQVDTVGKAFLGMTLGCARCHDHKFDPWKQEEYFALAGIFRNTKTFGDTNFGAIKHWNEFVFASAEERASIAEVEKRIAEQQKVANEYKGRELEKLRQEARGKVVEYLVAAMRLPPDVSLPECESVAGPLGLHPRILHQCRRHLEFARDLPFFQAWHAYRLGDDSTGLRAYYTDIFGRLAARAGEAGSGAEQPNGGKDGEEIDPRLEQAKSVLQDVTGLLALPIRAVEAFDAKTWEEYHRLSEEARRVESEAADLSAVMAVTDEPMIGVSVAMHIRGDHRRLGDKVERGFPRLLSGEVPATMPRHQSGRLELAQWLTSPQQVLVPRVLVNRFWGWHFGRPLVATTENFGALSEAPTHPELLDWLARDFVEQGWSLKGFHRRILLSRTYQRGSRSVEAWEWEVGKESKAGVEGLDASSPAFDDGRWLSSFPKRRLTGEELRDALLEGAGVLDGSMGGKSIPLRNRQFVFDHTSIDHTRYDGVRRTMYLPIVRNHLYGLLEQFDFPDPTMPAGRRHTTTVAPQALWLMNSELVLDCSQALARSSMDAGLAFEPAIEWVYQRLYQREPREEEVAAIAAFTGKGGSQGLGGDVEVRGDEVHQRALWIQALLCSPEFYQLD